MPGPVIAHPMVVRRLGHHVDNHLFRSASDPKRACRCGSRLNLPRDGSATHARHTLSCFLGHHTYERLAGSAGHRRCTMRAVRSSAHSSPMAGTPTRAQDFFTRKCVTSADSSGHKVTCVTERDGFVISGASAAIRFSGVRPASPSSNTLAICECSQAIGSPTSANAPAFPNTCAETAGTHSVLPGRGETSHRACRDDRSHPGHRPVACSRCGLMRSFCGCSCPWCNSKRLCDAAPGASETCGKRRHPCINLSPTGVTGWPATRRLHAGFLPWLLRPGMDAGRATATSPRSWRLRAWRRRLYRLAGSSNRRSVRRPWPFEKTFGVTAARTTSSVWQAALVGAYTAACWTVFVVASKKALVQRKFRPFAVVPILDIVARLYENMVSEWTACDMV